MDIKELRIGNIIQSISKAFGENHLGQWSITEEDMVYIIESENKSHYKPVPITEEYLLKFGFKKTTENAGTLICFKLDIITHSNRTMTIAEWIKSDKGHWQIWIESIDLVRIKYVHQLQNLHFALTGKELQ